MSIDWLNPSDDIVEARRVGFNDGYESAGNEAADEIACLQAIVGKLSKCWRLNEAGELVQDVPVVPGMVLYYAESSVEATVLAVWFDGTLDLQSHDECGMPVNSWKRLRYDGNDGYNTREAAEAAKVKEK